MGAVPFELVHLESVDSTNEECKRRLLAGQTTPLALWADCQSAGKGRRGRSFLSPPGMGLYLSLLLQPEAPGDALRQLTAWTAVAVSRAITQTTGLVPDIKWPNDLLLEGKKLCGILTEAVSRGGTPWVIIGIGVNLTQQEADFGPQLSPIATSLAQHGHPLLPHDLLPPILAHMNTLFRDFPHRNVPFLDYFRTHCVTLGRPVLLHHPQGVTPAQALDVDDNFALLVRDPDGHEAAVTSGEVSVRGLLGYP